MISQEEAVEKILARVRALPLRRVNLSEALDRFAAEDLVASLSLPPFDNSAMDGYAVVARSCAPGARLKVVGEQPAGLSQSLILNPGEAIRIFTGATLPAKADAVVMQEEVSVEGNEIVLRSKVEANEFIRCRGGDIPKGHRIVSKGDRITPQMIALLAAQGIGSLDVGGEVRAALISTGDELVAPGVELSEGQIYDANSQLLQALLWKCGVKVVSVSHCADHADEIESVVRAGTTSDVMIITGGVSVGARDFVKQAIAAAGGTLDLWRVAVKPGKPFLFGHAGACSIFGLPGNPISAFVTFLLFVRPALLKLMGARSAALSLPSMPARIEETVSNPGERPHYVRGVLSNGAFRPLGRQESHALFGLSRSNALLSVGPQETLAAGSMGTVLTWE